MKSIPVRVRRKWVEAKDIVGLELVPESEEPLPPFSAGAHVDLRLRPGLVRQYSLCNDPGERHRYVIAVARDPASTGGSIAVHDGIREGDLTHISEPRNHFPLVRARRYLLFAGGIGVTPLLCMAQRLAADEADFEMHYSARTPERAAFNAFIRDSAFSARVHMHYSHVDLAPGASPRLLDPYDLLPEPDDSTHIYVCGPEPFNDAVLGAATTDGWLPSNLHCERFAAQISTSTADTAFEIEIASSGETIQVPAGRSIADMLAQHGIEVELSCRRGVCGSCATGVLEGEPDHRDLVLGSAARARNDQLMPCCSRAKSSRLVLDL